MLGKCNRSEDNLNLLIKHFSSDLININSDKLQSQQKKHYTSARNAIYTNILISFVFLYWLIR